MAIPVDRDREFNPAIKRIMDKLDELEEKIDLTKSNTELQLKNFDKVMKVSKQVSHSQEIPKGSITHNHTDFK